MTEPSATVRSEEDRLFREWRAGRADFYPDGLVNEACFQGAPLKLLFLMKEVNDPKSTSGMDDLRQYLAEGARWQSWNEVTRWVEAAGHLHKEGEVLHWEALANIGRTDHSRRAEALKQVCVVNLKKSAGKGPTDHASLAQVAREDASFLQRQLALYRPDLTICCGSVVTQAVIKNKLLALRDEAQTTRGVRYFRSNHHGVVIDFSHPSARVAPNLLTFGLVDAVREVLAQPTT